ncbi:putative methyltransferase-domain-containing protein [Halteromyces radiatus]|uniref:putative methyltransferase-domain-containing protein n=1 Tax=Halteromyces radiatus TaxID=101107 RepID=UPI00221EDA89|nr:putative methyltransferase-domain-containing protein [Halteromyces radiatus]KAI8098806.1 putative methyltransferase-domain-containing protein [Halteromyces radiatus]
MVDNVQDKDFILGNKPIGINVEASSGPPSGIKVSNVLSLRQDIANMGLAGKIWHSAYTLQSYFSHDNGLLLDPPTPIPSMYHYNNSKDTNTNTESQRPFTILELGAGTGYCGIVLANMLGRQCQVYITDLEPVIPLIEENVKAHHIQDGQHAQVFCERLHWGNQQDAQRVLDKVGGHFDLVVISDCVYFPELFQPLMDTLLWICSNNDDDQEQTKVVIGYKCRSLEKETGFWDLHFGRYFDYEPVRILGNLGNNNNKENDNDNQDSNVGQLLGYEEQIYVFVGSRRHSNHIPAADDRFALLMFCSMDY